MASKTGIFEVYGINEQLKALDSLMFSNPDMEKKVQELIRQVLKTVRKSVSDSARRAMDSDPRMSYKAVRTSVYRRILGGQVNILNKRSSGARRLITSPRKSVSGQVGGNRIRRSQRTIDLQSYYGSDRGFILRFVNAGTQPRVSRYGNRGRIRGGGFFPSSSYQAMSEASHELEKLIDELISKKLS